MGFKEYEKNMSFLDMELSKTLGTSRTQRVLREIHDHIRWEPLERLLLAEYPVGKSPVGNAAYPPLMLLKAVLLQKWFGIRSDPELENQINDRVSFKVFMGLPLGDPSPDHSVISRFRDRVGSRVMERVHTEILRTAAAGERVFHRCRPGSGCEAGEVGIDAGEQGQDRGEEAGA